MVLDIIKRQMEGQASKGKCGWGKMEAILVSLPERQFQNILVGG